MCGRAAQTRHAVTLAAHALGMDPTATTTTTTTTTLPDHAAPAPQDDQPVQQYEWNDNYNLSPGMDAMVFYKGSDGKLCMNRKVWGIVTKRGTSAHPLPSGMGKHFEGLMFNARADTLYQKPTFGRLAGMGRSCVIALDGFFEWKTPVGGKGRKQPYFVQRMPEKGDDSKKPYLLMAGLWNQVPTGHENSPTLDTFTIITTDVCEPIAWLHSRMPVCIWDERLAMAWITHPTEKLHKVIEQGARQTPKNILNAYPVTTEMSSTKFRSADAIKPLPKERSVKDFFAKMSADAQKKLTTPTKQDPSTSARTKRPMIRQPKRGTIKPTPTSTISTKRQAPPSTSPSKRSKTTPPPKNNARIDFFFQPKK